MRWPILPLVLITLTLAACGSAGSPGAAVSGTGTPTAPVVNTAQLTPPAIVATVQSGAAGGQGGASGGVSGGGVAATEGAAPPTPTPLRGPVTISIEDLRAGQTLYLAVGDTFVLDSSVTGQVQIGDADIIARVEDAADPGRAQGSYRAIAPGKTELQITESPDCLTASPPCLAPGALLVLNIEVQ